MGILLVARSDLIRPDVEHPLGRQVKEPPIFVGVVLKGCGFFEWPRFFRVVARKSRDVVETLPSG